jgi:hypothetical protein
MLFGWHWDFFAPCLLSLLEPLLFEVVKTGPITIPAFELLPSEEAVGKAGVSA